MSGLWTSVCLESSVASLNPGATSDLIDRLLLERISLAGIARVMQRSEDCIQRYVNQKATTIATQVEVTNKPKKRLTVQMDELWSFVDKKGNEQWVWLALDAETREIVGAYIGDRAVSQLRPSGCPYPRYIDNVL